MQRYTDAVSKAEVLETYAELYDILEQIPTADVTEINVGKWINTGSGEECSKCHEIQYGYDSFRRYCPNCGAKMCERREDEH